MDLFFKENLRLLRKLNNMSQEELAKILNYSFRTISKWETGESVPSYESIVELTKIFNISISTLMEKDLSKYKNTKRFSSKLIDNKTLFQDFQKEIFKVLYDNKNETILKKAWLKNNKIYINDIELQEKFNILLKKEKIDIKKFEVILYKTLEMLKNNSLIEYFNLFVDEYVIKIEYKVAI